MSKSFNVVVLSGYLGQDPELKHVGAAATPLVSASVAVDDSYVREDGTKVDSTTWVPVKMWRGLAASFVKFNKKGDGVLIEGKLKEDKWTDSKTGQPRSRLVVEATGWRFPPTHKSGAARVAKAAVENSAGNYDEVEF